MLAIRVWAFVWKDVRLFLVDRQAVVMSFVVPLLIASILGWLDSTSTGDQPSKPIPVLVVDSDNSPVSQAVFSRLKSGHSVLPTLSTEAVARDQVRSGDVAVAILIPKGFGSQSAAAFLGGRKPELTLLTDPSKPIQNQVVLGTVVQDAAAAAAKQSFGALAGDGSPPFETKEVHAAATKDKWSEAAHDYAGFGLQGLLFFAMEAAVSIARERRMGIWKRLAASPVSPGVVIWSKGISSTFLALAILLIVFACGAGLFGIRVLGSPLGFVEMVFAIAAMAATFGLAIATLGKTETQSRGISILLILVMLATGGAWFPMQKMPSWVQSMANWLPVRWAVEGLDAVTWRGLGLAEASRYAGVLMIFAAFFVLIASLRFRSLAAQPG
jgi:ABC-2 type transport system permease protein